MRIKETKIYTYAELSEKAQDKARDWYRQCDTQDNFFAETPTDEFAELLSLLGFDATSKRGTSSVTWSGFSSQGDGAAFSGTWYANDMKSAKITAWLADHPAEYERDGKTHHCAHNKRWHDAIAPVVELRRQYPCASGSISVSNRGYFMHLESFDIGDEETATPNDDAASIDDAGESFIEAARGLADAFYRTLESEWEYQNSDAVIAENIIANEHEFTEDGHIS